MFLNDKYPIDYGTELALRYYVLEEREYIMRSPAEGKDRRITPDRRRRPTHLTSRYTFFGGRRETSRRETDKKKYIFVDSYSPYLLITLLFLLILGVLDCYFTLMLINEEIVVEANPIMALHLEYDNALFILLKFLITAIAVFVFCIGKNLSLAKVFLASAVVIYLFVVIYELNIMFKLYPLF